MAARRSPTTAPTDRADKMRICAAQAMQHLRFIDPSTGPLEAYRLESGRYSVLGTWHVDTTSPIEPF